MNELFYIAMGALMGYELAQWRGDALDLEVQS